MSHDTYVTERDSSVVHLELGFDCQPGSDRISTTDCGRRLNFDQHESGIRIFYLGWEHLHLIPCGKCGR